jgi:glycosyltransferase involved in cell wall biosynthesis
MKKNIAILIPKLTGGGAERVAANLSLFLSKKYSCHLIVYNDSNITYNYSGKLLCINDEKKNDFFGKFISLIKRIKAVRKIKNDYRIKATISLTENPNYVNIFSKAKDKIIVSVRIYKSLSTNNFYGKLNKFFMKVLYNKADYVVAVSELIKEDLINHFRVRRDKIKVIYNFYDIDRINELGSERIEDEYADFFKGKVITTMGRLEHQKGQAYLIRAFLKIKQDLPDAKLLIIGQGSLEKQLKRVAEYLGISDDVKFISFTENPFKYIKRSKLFVLTSLYEGFPNALCEAMACGVPVISSDCKSGPREILSAGKDLRREIFGIEFADYGVLVPVINNDISYNDTNLSEGEMILAIAMKKIIVDKKLWSRYSSKALQRVNDFSISSMMKKWEEILWIKDDN